MAFTLILLGYLIGNSFFPGDGGYAGIFIAIIIWTIMTIVSIAGGSSLLLSISKAQEVTPDVHRQLFNVVEEMKIASNLPAMPKVYIINSEAMNAFATGMSPDKSAVAVTAGLLSKMNRDELQGVVAHEISHIINRDTKFITYASVMLGSIVIISEIFLRGMFRGSLTKRYSSKSKGGGQAQLIILIVAVVFAILAPIMAKLLYYALSRKREYLADASAARITRYPEGLASALEKISECTSELQSANKVTAVLFIANPLKKKGKKLSDLTSTHPPISERIKILRGMMHGHGVNYRDYQEAFSAVKNSSSKIIPPSGLTDNSLIPIRSSSEDLSIGLTLADEKRKMGDIMMAVNNYSSLTCQCGLKLKIPPGFGTNKPEVKCPKCGMVNKVSRAARIVF
jgi:heat shock protein HtpX